MAPEGMEIEQIPPSIEKPFRKALGHAIRNEFDEFRETLGNLPELDLIACVGLCIFTAGYVAVDVCGREWPGERNLRKIAEATTESSFARSFGLSADDSYVYIKRVALQFEPLDEVFPDAQEDRDAILLTFKITGHLLTTYFPEGTHWFQFLDKIEQVYELSEISNLDVLPGMMLRARRERLAANKNGSRS